MKKRLIVLAALCFTATVGCTVFGEPFDEPAGELTLVGEVRALCSAGRAFYFGQVRNTGPLAIRDATAFVDVFNSAGSFLGRFQGPITESIEEIPVVVVDENGDPITDPETEEPVFGEPLIIPIDTLEVDQDGSFSVETTVGCSSAARQEVSFDFTVGIFADEEL